ncbi:hypothetical protein [Halobellus ruber]|uniref:ABC-2 type transport system permease protein n=1 Tax=Halobellus ruber TaxID=2761102 RepID=A0A7J9SKJ5_9EURY|nr:hypothetical protein [Halobellus ruber]MBB6646556.1 hypothetical protein [Halobellus ruber]
MSLQRDVRYGLRIGRAEFVRSLRGYLGTTRRLIGLGVVLLFFGGSLLLSLPTAYLLGRTTRSVTAIPFFEAGASAFPLVLGLVAMLRTLERIGSVEAEDLVLTTVHPRAVVLGLMAAEIGRLSLWFGVPIGALAVAFALGAGAPSLVLTGGLVALPLVCCAAVWGYAAGLGTLRFLRCLPAVRRVLKLVGVLAMVGVAAASQFVGTYIVEPDRWMRWLLSAATFDPLVAYVSLAFAGTPLVRPVSVGSVAVLGVALALTPIGLAVATKQASTLWFTDAPTRPTSKRGRTSSGGFTAPRPFAWTEAGRIAWGVLVRARRRPRELSHLLVIVFFIGPVGTTIVQSSGDAIGVLVAATGVGLGTVLAGAAFGLNPLGDDRPQLPLLLLTTTEPRALVRGRVVAGAAVGLPIAVLAPLASVGLGTAVPRALAFAGVGVGTCVAAATFAPGIGAAYPIYEEREFWGTETVVPSTLVMIGYLFVVGGGTGLGLVVTWFAVAGNLVLTLVFLVGFGAYVTLIVGVSYGAYRYAIRRYRRYAFD